MDGKVKELMDARGVKAAVEKLAAEIVAAGGADPAIVGIRNRGLPLAERIIEILEKNHGVKAELGALGITLYRDDLSMIASQPVVKSTEINFDVNGRRIVLVDDVLFTGRTVRAAMSELLDYGRPSTIELAVLVDRGHRELPIAANYSGRSISTRKDQVVDVLLEETDGRDAVVVTDERIGQRKGGE